MKGEVVMPEVTIVTETSLWERAAVILSAITLLFFVAILYYPQKSALEAERANDQVAQPWVGFGMPMAKYVYDSASYILKSAGKEKKATL